MRLRMMLSEAFRSVAGNAATTVAATMTVLIGMFLLGLFIALGSWAMNWSDEQKDKLLVKVYFCTPYGENCTDFATNAQINAAGARLKAMPEVADIDFVSRDDALEIMDRRRPDLTEGLAQNPFPASFEVTPRRAEDARVIKNRLQAQKPRGVEKVDDGGKVADRILDVAAVISVIFAAAVAVLVIAATVLIANTIRLSIFARRREIEVMKLVGATNWFVRGPFMIEGLICGLAGSVLAVILLLAGKEFALPAILDKADDSGVGALPFAWTALILVGVGLLLGAAGSGLTLRRFLRV
jgi:cell division transport system permease protein